MRKSRFGALAGAMVLTLATVGSVVAQDASPSASAGALELGAAAGKKLYVNMKGPGGGNPFWAAVQKGAEDEGAALGADVTVLAPPTESDVQAQIAQMEDAVTQGAAGIAIAPTDPAALAPSIQAAMDAGVKIVFVDTKGSNEGVTYIGTDNEVGAALAGQYLCDNVPAGGKVAILQGVITTSTGKARADGAHKAVTDCGLNLVAEVPANFDKAEGQAAMEDILTKNPDLAGVFASNDNMALGAVQALKAQNLVGKVIVVGFDANPDAAQAILAGEMNATIAQSPANMGKFSVDSLVRLINGETLPAVIDTGTALVTAENAADYTAK